MIHQNGEDHCHGFSQVPHSLHASQIGSTRKSGGPFPSADADQERRLDSLNSRDGTANSPSANRCGRLNKGDHAASKAANASNTAPLPETEELRELLL